MANFGQYSFSSTFFGSLKLLLAIHPLRAVITSDLQSAILGALSSGTKQTGGLSKGGFSKGGFCSIQCHAPEKQELPEDTEPTSTFGAQSATAKRGVHCTILQRPLMKKTFSWLLISWEHLLGNGLKKPSFSTSFLS